MISSAPLRHRTARAVSTLLAATAVLGGTACMPVPLPAEARAEACPAWEAPPPAPPAADGGPADPAEAQRYQAVLEQVRAAGRVPGLVASVQSPDGTWVGTSGTEGEGLTGAPSAQHLTRVGSLTKTMTATVLLQMVERCGVRLDATIGSYVPGIPNPQATLLQVADMSSGIPSYTKDEEFTRELFADPERVWSPEELVDVVRGAEPSFAPGEGWEYSNTNYVLLGLVIEQVTGQPIADVFEERLFGPLGMDDTSYPTGSPAIGDPHLSGLTEQGQPDGTTADATGWSPSEGSTAGEVISTLDDLTTWAHALFTGDGILSGRMQALRRGSIIYGIPPASSPTSGYGIGIGDKDGWWGHDGQIPGYTTVISHDYDLDTTIIVVANSDIPVGDGPPPAPAVLTGLIKAVTTPGVVLPTPPPAGGPVDGPVVAAPAAPIDAVARFSG